MFNYRKNGPTHMVVRNEIRRMFTNTDSALTKLSEKYKDLKDGYGKVCGAPLTDRKELIKRCCNDVLIILYDNICDINHFLFTVERLIHENKRLFQNETKMLLKYEKRLNSIKTKVNTLHTLIKEFEEDN